MKSLLSRVALVVVGLCSTVVAAGVAGTLVKPKVDLPLMTAVVRQNVPVAIELEALLPAPPPAAELSAPWEDYADEHVRTHRIRLSPDGLVPGKILVIDSKTSQLTPAAELTITFLQQGEVITRVRPGEGGVFQATGLAPGIYSVVASGRSGFAAFGVELMEPEVATALRPQRAEPVFGVDEIRAELAIETLAIPPGDLSTVAQLIRSYIPAATGGSVPWSNDRDFLPERPPADAGSGQETAGFPATTLQRHSVMLQADGRLLGQMRRLDPQTGRPLRITRLHLFLVKDNQVMGQAGASELGLFEVKGLQPGNYSVVAAGTDGFAAFAVQVRPFVKDAIQKGTVPGQLILPASFAQLGSSEAAALKKLNYIVSVLTQAGDTSLVFQELQAALEAAQTASAASAATGTGAPGSGGAGGSGVGAGGTGPLSTLLGLAAGGALGAGIAELANSNPSSP